MDVPMSVVVCARCNTPFAMPSDTEYRLRKCHNTFYCPMGHPQSFPGKSDEEELREKLAAERRKVEQYEEEKREALRVRQAAAKKAIETKKAKKAKK